MQQRWLQWYGYYRAERSDRPPWVKTILSFLASFKGLATPLFVDNTAFISNIILLQRRRNVTIMQYALSFKLFFPVMQP